MKLKNPYLVYNKLSRRMFIRSVGGGLVAFPLLESLLGAQAFAQSASNRKRFVAITTPNQLSYNYISPSRFNTASIPTGYSNVTRQLADAHGHNYRAVNLSDVISREGQISDLLDGKWNQFSNQLIVYRGVDFPGRVDHGRAAIMGNIAGSHLGTDYGLNPTLTMDEIMAESANFYSGGRSSVPLSIMRIGGTSISTNNLIGAQGAASMRAPLTNNGNLKLIFDNYFGEIPSGNNQNNGVDPKKNVLDRILASLTAVTQDKSLGGEDRVRVEEYSDKLRDLASTFGGGGPSTLTCSTTGVNPPDFESASWGNQANGAGPLTQYTAGSVQMTALAIKCGVSQIITNGISTSMGASIVRSNEGPPRTWHLDVAHQGGFEELLNLNKWIVDNYVFQLAQELNVNEGSSGQTYLDNTTIYFTPECSYGHGGEGMSGFILGNRQSLNSGQFFDYGDYQRFTHATNRQIHHGGGTLSTGLGLPIPQLFVTLMRASGLSSSDYLNKFGSGANAFGDWRSTYANGWESYLGGLSRTNRNEPLPGMLRS